MSESTHDQDRDPQITGGGGHEPDPSQSAHTSGAGSEDDRQNTPGPTGGAGVDLKTSELPEPGTDPDA